MKHLFKDTIRIFGTITRNDANEETFADGANFKCRFQLKNKLLVNREGENIMADAFAMVNCEANTLAIGVKCTVNSVNYRVVGLKEAKDDLSNVHHYSVWLQRWEGN